MWSFPNAGHLVEVPFPNAIFSLCYSLHNNSHMEEFQSTNNNVLDNGVCVWAHVHMCDHHFIVIAFYGCVLYYCAWSSFNHVRLIILVAFFSSEQAHLIVVTFFWLFFFCCCAWSFSSHLPTLLCIMLLFPSPHFHGVWVCKDGAARSAKLLQCH